MKLSNPQNENTASTQEEDAPIRFMRRKEVQDKTGLGTSTIYALMAKGKFPKAVPITDRCVAWIESEVDQWIAERLNARTASLSEV